MPTASFRQGAGELQEVLDGWSTGGRDRAEIVERSFKIGGHDIYVKSIGLHLEFRSDEALNFAAIQANLPATTPAPEPGGAPDR